MKKILWKNSFIFLIVLLVLSNKVFSSCDRYVEVGGNGNGECDTEDSPCGSIKYAVEKSANNDIICVGPGTYTFESEISTSKDLTIIATSYPAEETIIDGNGFNVRAFHLQSNDFIINGFTIQNFRVNNLHGCPFYLDCSSPNSSKSIQFINCIIKDNKAHTGIIKSYGCYLNFENVRIQSNEAIGQGGGLFCDRNENYIQPQIKYTDLIISGNSAQSFDNIFNQLKTGAYEGPACAIVSGPDLQSCDECNKGGNCNPETGSCDCLPGSHLPSPGCEFCQSGQYSTEVNSTVCSICDAGEFNNESGLTKCQKCDPGSYQDQEGQSECKECDAGFYNSNNGSDSINDCIPCEIGSYSDQIGQVKCQECDFGSYQDQTGKLECIKCDAGFYNTKQGSNSSSDCIPCEKGTYSDQTGQLECQKCDPGSYQDQAGQNKCIKCDGGFYNTKQGSNSIDDCIPCEKGTYSDQTGQSECQKCDPGSYQDQAGQNNCIKCDPGLFNSKQGSDSSSDCIPCEKGTYSNQTGQAKCPKCDPGSYQDQTGKLECIKCDAGFYNANDGSNSSSDCIRCEKGTYSDQIGQSTECTKCDQGSYQDQEGQVECIKCKKGSYNSNHGSTSSSDCFECEIGSYSDQEGSSSCSLCIQGQYNNKRNSTTCLDCSTGSYSNHEGQTICQYCSAGEYQDELHSVQCKPCSFNTWQSNTGSYKCNYCPMNSITLKSNTIDPKECFCSVGYFGKAGESCEKCPTNGICDQLNQQNPKPQSGYWNSNDNPQDLIECKIEDACPGNGIGVCSGELGYTGFQCEQCLSGFYKFEEQCLTCPDNNWFRLLLAFFLLLVFVVLLIFVAKKGESYFGSLTILISFFQIIVLFPKMLFNWPFKMQNFFKNFTFFNLNLDMLALECSLNLSYTEKCHCAILNHNNCQKSKNLKEGYVIIQNELEEVIKEINSINEKKEEFVRKIQNEKINSLKDKQINIELVKKNYQKNK
ncbi:hypothetical protein M0812_22861 [Anaeramoeba flamelloides]|uniref:TNFR-Cys domain-containing protein n=1 Tax=Anaeramoeba flamelloides TaxID=1746091 RepID=A0AAV7YMG1_9EUKA|nr:hypothetical protein M0812_22861 [Anaeramoeba flamelloides]